MLHLITVTYENLIILILPGSISQFKPVLTQLISTAVNPVSKTASVIIGNFTKKEKKKKKQLVEREHTQRAVLATAS